MITIDQLLESVDLDFEPRWVTKDEDGTICICDGHKPEPDDVMWDLPIEANYDYFGRIKLAEFDGKDWTECIYKIKKKEKPVEKIEIGTLYIDKGVTFGDGDDDDVGFVLEDYESPRKTTEKIEKLERHIEMDNDSVRSCPPSGEEFMYKINELVDAVNELKGANNG